MPTAFDLLAHLSTKSIQWGDYRLPMRYFPNQKHEIWEKSEENIVPKQPILKDIKVYTLVNANTFSFGENPTGISPDIFVEQTIEDYR